MARSRLLAVFLTSGMLTGADIHGVSANDTMRDATGNGAEELLFGNLGTGGSMYSLGALLGMSFLDGGGGTQPLLGFNADYKLAPNYGAGLYFTYNSSGALATTGMITLAPQANYYFEGLLAGARVGAKAGFGFLRGPSGSTSVVFGPHLGYDQALGDGLSVGGEGNVLFYSGDSGCRAINVLVALRYWF